jgi:hypothetical protein
MTNLESSAVQWHGAYDNPMMQRVQEWLAEGRTLAWLPILNAENFPEVPPAVLYQADLNPQRHCWLIEQVEDFLAIPEGITGWVLPNGDQDTDVVVGLWEDTLRFCRVVDHRTGLPQTLQTGRAWEVDPDAAQTADRVGF